MGNRGKYPKIWCLARSGFQWFIFPKSMSKYLLWVCPLSPRLLTSFHMDSEVTSALFWSHLLWRKTGDVFTNLLQKHSCLLLRKYKSRQERITSLGHSQSACHINPYSSVKALAQHNTRHGHPVNQANDSGKEKGKKYVWQIRPHPSANTPRSSTTLIHHPNSPPKPSWNPPFSITSISQDHHNRSSLRLP